jgi:hypothetical protein
LREAALVEAQSRGLNPQDKCEELMELVELQRPLLAALSTSAGGFGRCGPTITRDHFPIAQNKGNPKRLLTRVVLGGDIKQLIGVV